MEIMEKIDKNKIGYKNNKIKRGVSNPRDD